MLQTTIAAWGSGVERNATENPMACDEVTWRIESRDGVPGDGAPKWKRTPCPRTPWEQDSTEHEGLYSRGFSPVDRSFVLNSNSISYILVTAQYFRALLGDTHWTYQGSLPKTPQTPNVLKLASITTDCERYT
jgi:hypothetical protein